MDQLRESSLLFSLESLLETERERVQREAREAQKRHDDELKRVAEVGERRRLAAQQEREARERSEALERERVRLEHESIEAMKRATVERTRIEAEGRLRLLEVEQARQHDLKLAKIRETARTAGYRTLSWLSSSALVAVSLGAVLGYFVMLRPAHARETEQLRTLVGVADERAGLQERLLAGERSKSEKLGQRVAELESRLAEMSAASAHAGKTGATTGDKVPRIMPPPPEVKGTPCKDNGDPLDDCVGGRRPRR